MKKSEVVSITLALCLVNSNGAFGATAPISIQFQGIDSRLTLAGCHNEDGSESYEGNLEITPYSPFENDAVIMLANCHTEKANNPPATDHGTESITDALARAERLCRQIPVGYKIDCLSVQYAKIARLLPKGGDYGVVRDVLTRASEDLHKIAKDNRDRTEDKTDFAVQLDGRRETVGKPIHPIRPAAQAAANAAAIRVIQEAQTVLLRSTENSNRRKVHYQRIAMALESNKVLLRS